MQKQHPYYCKKRQDVVLQQVQVRITENKEKPLGFLARNAIFM